MAISLGAAGFNSITHESERPKMEAQLRKSLNEAFDEEWLDLMRNPDTGVLAGSITWPDGSRKPRPHRYGAA
ncbi:hypothetical protein ACE0DR_14425 [Azotobacter sp. CWF10]